MKEGKVIAIAIIISVIAALNLVAQVGDTTSIRTLKKTKEINNHTHTVERWFGRHATQSGNNWAKQDTLGAFQLVSGNNDWGDTLKVLGSGDTPVTAGKLFADSNHLLISDVSQATVYKLRMIWGSTNASVELAAGNYTETMIITDKTLGNTSGGVPIVIMTPSGPVGSKVWMQCWNATNSATIDFFIGIHEYEE